MGIGEWSSDADKRLGLPYSRGNRHQRRSVQPEGVVFNGVNQLQIRRMDAIQISTIRCYGYTGYFPEEQVLGQWFEVDLTISMDLSITGADDNLENTLNYAEVVDRVSTLVETSRFKTIERLNAVITEAVLAFAPVQSVRSRLVKVSPPIPGFAGSIAIEMTRSKGASR